MSRRLSFARPLVLAVAALGWLVPVAQAASDEVVIQACVQPDTGSIRIVGSAKEECAEFGEEPLTWNQQGPQGPQGEAGPTGDVVARRWWRDADGDGYGDWYEFLDSPSRPPGYVDNRDDCHDGLAEVNPASTIPDFGRPLVVPPSFDNRPRYWGGFQPVHDDHDCNGRIGEEPVYAYRYDRDRDGAASGSSFHYVVLPLDQLRELAARESTNFIYEEGAAAFDCDDGNPNVRHVNDQGCSNGYRASNGDLDGDGHWRIGFGGGDDCDDTDGKRFPGNAEVRDTWGHDEDCDARTAGGGAAEGLLRDNHPWDERRPIRTIISPYSGTARWEQPLHADEPEGPRGLGIIQPAAPRPPAVITPQG